MIEVGAKVTMPDLTILTPKRKEWLTWAVALKGIILKRTIKGFNWLGASFKGYTNDYAKKKAEGKIKIKGGVGFHERTGGGVVNLTLSNKMLGGMKESASDRGGKITLSNEEADKAMGNEKNGRIFFAVSDKDSAKIIKLVDRWLTKKNGLK